MTNELSSQPQYCPSDEVVSIVRDSLELCPYKMEAEGDALTKVIKNTTAQSLANLFATIGRELSRGEEDNFSLTINGEFTKPALDAITFRILVEKQFVEEFSKYLYKDLISCASTGSLDTNFSKLSLVGDELVLLRTQVLAPKEKAYCANTKVFSSN